MTVGSTQEKPASFIPVHEPLKPLVEQPTLEGVRKYLSKSAYLAEVIAAMGMNIDHADGEINFWSPFRISDMDAHSLQVSGVLRKQPTKENGSLASNKLIVTPLGHMAFNLIRFKNNPLETGSMETVFLEEN